jgi:hypothetical protein
MWGHYQNAYLELDTASAENGPTLEVYSPIRWVCTMTVSQTHNPPWRPGSSSTQPFTSHVGCMEDWKTHNDGSVAVGLWGEPGD